MASISTDATGNRKIQFVNGDGKRKSVYLGKILKADAKEICSKIEAILAALLSRRSLAAEVAEWVGNVPDVLAEKLVGVGLIAPRVKQQKDATTLGSFIDAYLVSRTDIKPRTRINFMQVRRDLIARFGEHMDDYRRDALAATWRSEILPIPEMVLLDSTTGPLAPVAPYVAVTERLPGQPIESLSTDRMNRASKSLFERLATLAGAPHGFRSRSMLLSD